MSFFRLFHRGAFDNITHQSIITRLAVSNYAQRLYDCIASFLTNRTATVGIWHLSSDAFQTIPKGNPQGSVISPLLFNIGMKDIPPLLTTILKLPHALYA